MCFRANKERNALAKEIQSENLSFLRINHEDLKKYCKFLLRDGSWVGVEEEQEEEEEEERQTSL